MIRAARSLHWAWLLVPFAAFAATVQGRIQYWDTGEMQIVPWIFGIPHPTGFPAYVLLTGAFVHVFAIGTAAWRASFFCGMLMLGCVALVYGAIGGIARDWRTGVCAGALLAFGWYFWMFGDRAEVHAPAAFFTALALVLALRGYYDASARAFFGAFASLGFGLATHPVALFAVPAIVLLAAARRAVFGLRGAAIAALLLLAPLALYAYLPLRSHVVVAQGLDPAAALGKPPGAAIWNTDNPQTARGFVRLVTGSDFHAGRSVLRILDLPYYGQKLGVFASAMYREFTPVGAIATFLCLAMLFRRRPVVAFALLLTILLPAAFALAYPPVVEIERYFFVPMIATALVIGFGIAAMAPQYRNMLRVPILAAAAVLLVTNYPDARLRANFGAEDLIAYVRRATPANAIVMADWTRGTALAYARYVNVDLRGRAIEIAWPFQDRRYLPRWLAERPVYYVGRPVLHTDSLLLCRTSEVYPVYRVQWKPAHC